MPKEPAAIPPAKTPEERIREAVNMAGVAIVQQGFDAIDELAERGKFELKKRLISLVAARKKK